MWELSIRSFEAYCWYLILFDNCQNFKHASSTTSIEIQKILQKLKKDFVFPLSPPHHPHTHTPKKKLSALDLVDTDLSLITRHL